MTPRDYEVKLKSIMRYLEGALKDARAQYFDPRVTLEYFERYNKVRTALKAQYGERFADLHDRELPQSSGTSDYDGHGYIVRRHLDQLYEDCRYAVEILEVISESANVGSMPTPASILSGVTTDIFISHASKDVALVSLFTNNILRLGLDLPSERIFCTSLEGMGIQNGTDFREQILKALHTARIVVFLITPNYKMSEVCQNEMGAAWYSGKQIVPFIIDPIDYKSVGVLMEPKQIPKLNDPDALSRFRDDVIRELGLGFKKTDLWDAHKEAFLKDYPSVLASLKLPKARTPKEMDDLESESKLLKEQLAEAGKRIKQLQDQFDAVAKLKDIKAVEAVQEKFDNREPLDKLEALTSEIKRALKPFSKVVRAVIVCSYYNQPYSPPYDAYTEDLQAGERKKQIYYDDPDFSPNSDNPDVKKLFTALEKIGRFIKKETKEDFVELYEKEYTSPLDLSNEDFWEEHFDVKVPT